MPFETMMSWLKKSIVSVATIFLSGCMVGPDFTAPAPPTINSYLHHSPQRTVAKHKVSAQFFVKNKQIPAQWWKLFHSQALNRLIKQGMQNSPNLQAATYAIMQARENVNVTIGNTLFPAFDFQGAVSRERQNSDSFTGVANPTNIFNVFNTNVNVSYTLDTFGGNRRQIEGLRAQVDYQNYKWLAAYLTLTTNIVTTTVTIASLDEQIRATHALIAAYTGQLRILENQYHLGGIPYANVASQKALVMQTEATLPPLQKSLAQNQHALTTLLGLPPNASLPTIGLRDLHLPRELPVSLPSQLVKQRPDIGAQTALLHAASAQIGVATANLFPQLTLSGNLGWQALNMGSLFGPSTYVWTMTGNLAQPIFHGGALFASRRLAIDAYKQTLAEYQQTVLQALQNVADSLKAIEIDAREYKAQLAAEKALATSLKITRDQYRLGGVSFVSVLVAEQQYQQTHINRIAADAARYADTAALFQALGGGWWNKCNEQGEFKS